MTIHWAPLSCSLVLACSGPPTSPKYSAYGVSPTTTTPMAPRGTGAMRPRSARRIPARIVVPGITFADEPCQFSVQPPAWSPIESAFEPAT